jgi:hypothetical protein
LFHSRKLARIATLAVLLSAAFVSIAASAANSSACTATPEDQSQVVETMRTMYAAATVDDLVKFHTVATPDFYAFDGGQRYDGDALMNMVKSYHEKGVVFVWTVAGTHPTTWLESAMLEKQAGAWRIHFFHSTRVP